jgi:hypothetical protein
MNADYRPSLVRSFERHLRAENRSEHTIASYLESLRQAEAFLIGRGRSLVDARREEGANLFRDDVLAVLLGRLTPTTTQAAGVLGPRTLRQRLGRWQEAGWVERRRMLGHTWVLPTRAGLRLAGLDFDVWEPAEPRLAHHHAVAVVRLARELAPGRAGWVCERELWRRRSRASWHLADGALPAPVPAGWHGIDQAWELVEVELHQKARPRVVAALKTRPPHTAAITYYVPAALHAPLSAQLAGVVRELGGRPRSRLSRSRRCRGSLTCRPGVMPDELASRGPSELGRPAAV